MELETQYILDGWIHVPRHEYALDSGTLLVLFGTIHLGLPHAYERMQSEIAHLRTKQYQVIMEGDFREKAATGTVLGSLPPRMQVGMIMAAGLMQHCGLVLERSVLSPSRLHGDVAVELPQAKSLSRFSTNRLPIRDTTQEYCAIAHLLKRGSKELARDYLRTLTYTHKDCVARKAPSSLGAERDRLFAEVILSYLFDDTPVVGVFGSNHLPGIVALIQEAMSLSHRDVTWIPIQPPPATLLELLS